MNENEMFNNSVVVVAHPDDEIIWMSSILGEVDKIIVCFLDELSSAGFGVGKVVDYYRTIKYGSCSNNNKSIQSEIGSSRDKVLKNYPIKGIKSLGLSESGSFGLVDWCNPKRSPYGIHLDIQNRSVDRPTFGARFKKDIRLIRRRYEQNYKKLVFRLTDELKGVANVFTHNPWGEYGHPDHIQVNKALVEVQKDLGFDIYVTTYCGIITLKLVNQYLPLGLPIKEYVSIETDRDLARQIVSLYKKYNCWTYHDDWNPMKVDTFIKSPGRIDNKRHTEMFNYPPGCIELL